MKLSIIIPAYREPYLQKTITSLLDTSKLGDQVEILPIIDGPWLKEKLKDDPRVRVIQLDRTLGMRGAINSGLREATGEYIMKVDSHCLFAPGFDKKMAQEMKEDWLLIPRRYSLDEITWKPDYNRPHRDYHYFEKPHKDKYGEGLVILDWFNKKGPDIDDTMTFQGSCWLAQREYFMKHVGFLDDQKYGSFVGEQHEIGLKYWLGGGEVKVNKKTWYAHLAKRSIHYDAKVFSRARKTAPETAPYHTATAEYWMHTKDYKHDFNWLLKKFSPPTW